MTLPFSIWDRFTVPLVFLLNLHDFPCANIFSPSKIDVLTML